MRPPKLELYADNEQAMQVLGESLSSNLIDGMSLYLDGELGIGKTTLVRGMLRGLGYSGTVKSPTFTLVESYHIGSVVAHHMDFYRVDEPLDLEMIGIRDYLDGSNICFIEWPERAGKILPAPDVKIQIEHTNPGRVVNVVVLSKRAQQFTKLLN